MQVAVLTEAPIKLYLAYRFGRPEVASQLPSIPRIKTVAGDQASNNKRYSEYEYRVPKNEITYGLTAKTMPIVNAEAIIPESIALLNILCFSHLELLFSIFTREIEINEFIGIDARSISLCEIDS